MLNDTAHSRAGEVCRVCAAPNGALPLAPSTLKPTIEVALGNAPAKECAMSPRTQFNGKARQRGAIGLMAAATLSLALVLMLLVVDTGRLYMEQRKLQRVVDSAAGSRQSRRQLPVRSQRCYLCRAKRV
jgi:hypothetical protein